MSRVLEGAASLVVGGGSGIGRAVVDGYVADGGVVTVLERSAERAEQLVDESGGAVGIVVGDATDPGAVARAVGAAAARTGRLDNLTTCAGVHDGRARLNELSADELVVAFDEIYRANVLTTLLPIRLAAPHLAAASGSVVVTLSESAFYPRGGGSLYASSKWALRGVVQHLAVELGPRVRVNGVAPGGTKQTHLAGLNSLGQVLEDDAERAERIRQGTILGVAARPADHVGAYVYLASPRLSAVVTGAVINSDGGYR
ncbi:MAG: SDR family NAD(P)-dependent oxidoreductase [Actinobacteria bacterium]|nr:SDR family NAD(P)-dependent oxidoreductase [Actinomycetota bacterium]